MPNFGRQSTQTPWFLGSCGARLMHYPDCFADVKDLEETIVNSLKIEHFAEGLGAASAFLIVAVDAGYPAVLKILRKHGYRRIIATKGGGVYARRYPGSYLTKEWVSAYFYPNAANNVWGPWDTTAFFFNNTVMCANTLNIENARRIIQRIPSVRYWDSGEKQMKWKMDPEFLNVKHILTIKSSRNSDEEHQQFKDEGFIVVPGFENIPNYYHINEAPKPGLPGTTCTLYYRHIKD